MEGADCQLLELARERRKKNQPAEEDCDSHYYGSFAKSENKTIWVTALVACVSRSHPSTSNLFEGCHLG